MLVTCTARKRYRVATCLVGHVNVGTRFNQHATDVDMPGRRRQHQWRGASLVDGIDVGSAPELFLDGRAQAIHYSQPEEGLEPSHACAQCLGHVR